MGTGAQLARAQCPEVKSTCILILGRADMYKRLSLLTLGLLTVIIAAVNCAALRAQESNSPTGEEIQSFDSDVTVNPDSTLLVHETVTILALGARIKHGIYRDIPTRYNDRFGNPYAIHFEVSSVTREGQPEEFHLEKLSNGLRVEIGESSEVVPSGQHTYELTYTVDRELGFFPDHDELYWNVTGNGWIFPIQAVTTTVHLPKGIVQEAIITDAYTGRPGSVENESTASADNQSNVTFHTNHALSPHESMTFVVRWPKGFVSPPTDEQKHQYFLEDNRPIITGALGFVVLLIYYVVAWFMVGRNQARGAGGPSSEPPRGFSPAAVRCAWRAAFDRKVLIANLVDLAVKKRLAILEDVSGGFILGRLNPHETLPGARPGTDDRAAPAIAADEKLLLNKLVGEGDTIRLEPAHRVRVGGAVEALHQHLRTKLEMFYFLTNSRYLIPGLLISFATVARSGYLMQGVQIPLLLFLTAWVLLASMACLVLVTLAVAAWRNAVSNPHHAPTARKQAAILSAICLLFIIGELAGLGWIAWVASTGVLIFLILLVASNCAFHLLLKLSNRADRGLMDQIEGLRQFMTTTELTRRDVRTPFKSAPILFERLLPYAMALNLEKVWCEKFAAALTQTTLGKPADYSPAWYSGPAWDRIFPADFANSLGNSFSRAISSSSGSLGANSGGSGPSGSGGG